MAKAAERKAKRKIVYANPQRRLDNQAAKGAVTTIKLPEGVKVFTWEKPKLYRLEILGYVVGEGNPNADPGTVYFERTYGMHPRIGPKEIDVCCLAETFGEPCPVCDEMLARRNAGDDWKTRVQPLKPKERQLFYVLDLDNEAAGVQILETANYMSFGELLDNKLAGVPEDSKKRNFYHLGMDGMTLYVHCKDKPYTIGQRSGTYVAPSNIEFEDRKKPVPEEYLDQLKALDDLFIKMEYNEFNALWRQERPTNNTTITTGEEPAHEVAQEASPNGDGAPDATEDPVNEEVVDFGQEQTEEEVVEEDPVVDVGVNVQSKKGTTGVVEKMNPDGTASVRTTEGKLVKIKVDDLDVVVEEVVEETVEETPAEEVAEEGSDDMDFTDDDFTFGDEPAEESPKPAAKPTAKPAAKKPAAKK